MRRDQPVSISRNSNAGLLRLGQSGSSERLEVRKGGRPRKDVARTPSGRVSKALTAEDRDKRGAESLWRSFVIFSTPINVFQPMQYPIHCLLRLVRQGNLHSSFFKIAMAWAASSYESSPRWPWRSRLTTMTGFDFQTRQGCAEARRFAAEGLGPRPVEILNRAVFADDLQCTIDELAELLDALWAIWVEHGESGREASSS